MSPEASPAAGAASCPNGEAVPVFDFRKPGAGGRRTRGHLEKTVFFVGFMGAGKTSTVRKLARLAGVAAVDMDTFTERHCDMKVRDVIGELGEERFRAIEADVLRELAEGEPCLVSCGGGAVLKPENRAIMRARGYVVYLKVTAEEAASRISNLATRPLFGDPEHANEVIRGRIPLYEEVANLTIDTAGRGTGSIAREALRLLRREGILRFEET